MKSSRLIAAAVGLTLGLAGMHGAALAQIKDAPLITGNVDGSCVTTPSADSPGVSAGDWTITCGDLSPGAGTTVISPAAVASDPVPAAAPEPAPEAAPEPVSEPAPVAEPAPETTEAAPVESAAASDTDLDADNYLDAAELEVGLDPNNPDTDGDGVADGDEVDIYLTDPFTPDSDGDGLSDGGELFDTRTDPLAWDTNGDGVADGEQLPA